jgi:hypothetical protein
LDFSYKEVYKLALLGDDAEFFRDNIIDDKQYPEIRDVDKG